MALSKKSVLEHLRSREIMQLATVDKHGQPWCSSLHYVVDDDLTIYWQSLADRRHSQDVAKPAKAAIAVAIKTSRPPVGVQAEGIAERVTSPNEVKHAAEVFNKLMIKNQDWLTAYLSGQDHGFKMYKFTPKRFVVFDRVAEPNNFEAALTELKL